MESISDFNDEFDDPVSDTKEIDSCELHARYENDEEFETFEFNPIERAKKKLNDNANKYPIVQLNSELFQGREKKDPITFWKSTPTITSQNISKLNLLNRNEKYSQLTLPKGMPFQNPIESFRLFFDDDILDQIIKFTNVKALSEVGNEWKIIDRLEMEAFLSLLIVSGIR
ncbi:hypothetical protein BLOT_006989 [Blomia tropicalis]|nr:hypothetical protein BLOT_006989 [Blomia tropicalis]